MKLWGPMTLVCALAMVSCAEKNDEDDSTRADDALQPIVEQESEHALEVDATNRSEWVGLDLDSAAPIDAASLPNATGWDLAFKRTSIKMGSTVAMQVVNQDYAAVTTAPQDGYIVDQPGTDPGAPETAGLAFHLDPSWYAYDINTHVVSSRSLVYVIKTSEGRTFKLRIKDYYNAARLPAYINLEFQELTGATP